MVYICKKCRNLLLFLHLNIFVLIVNFFLFSWTGNNVQLESGTDISSKTNILGRETLKEKKKKTLQDEEDHPRQKDSVIRQSRSPIQRRKRRIKSIRCEPSSDCNRERDRSLDKPHLPTPPAVRSSSRLAAKPRRVHSLSSAAQSASPKQAERQRKGSAEVPTVSTIAAASSAEDAPEWQPEARQRRYRCSSCGKRFYQLGHLRKHQFSHTDEKPFSCQDCGKSYTSSESYRAHQVTDIETMFFLCPYLNEGISKNDESSQKDNCKRIIY